MGRPSYVCTTCSEHFTRKYSARRHNNNLHNGAAEIVRLIDYLAGRSSGQYTPNNPFWFKRKNPYHDIGSLTVADSVGDSFQPTYIPQRAPVGISQHPPTMEDQKYGPGLSRQLKNEELKRLMGKHSQYHENPNGVIRYAVYNSINDDDTILDDKLEQLRSIDRFVNLRF
jgi:hypothetical protein